MNPTFWSFFKFSSLFALAILRMLGSLLGSGEIGGGP